MKFDVVIGNPPYQDSNGGGGNGKSAKSIYTDFINNALSASGKGIVMITPNRWLTEDNNTVWNLRKRILSECEIKYIKTYSNSWDVFPTIGNIAGGVGYFYISKEKGLGITNVVNNIRGKEIAANIEYSENDDIIFTDAVGVSILNKIDIRKTLTEMVSQTNPFGLNSDQEADEMVDDTTYCNVLTSSGNISVRMERITRNINLLKSYKVVTSKYAPSGGFADKDGRFKVISKSDVLKPYEACTQSYLILGPIFTENEAVNLCNYLKLKFVRFLMNISVTGMSITDTTFRYVPIQDFNKSYTDEELYQKYNLSNQEIEYIENLIKDFGG